MRRIGVVNGEKISRVVDSTLGRFIFNEIIPQDLGFVDRSNPDNVLVPEIDFLVGKKQLKKIIDKCINTHGATKTAEVLDNIKSTGYKYSTRSAITVSVSDMTVPDAKQDLLKEAEKTIEVITKNYRRGLVTEEERYKAVIEAWSLADKKITDALLGGLDKYNNIYMMADSAPVVPISRLNSWQVCVALWQIHRTYHRVANQVQLP